MMLLVLQAGNSDWTWIGSGCFVIIGALIAYLGTRRTLKMQREITEQQIKSTKEVNQAQMNEKLILENRVAWDNETRELVSKLIGQFFSVNHVIDKAKLVKEKFKMAADSGIPVEQRRELLSISEAEKDDLKSGMKKIDETVETTALIRLHLFEDTPNEQRLWDKINDVEQHMTKLEKIPSSELNELTEIARIYFQGNWERSMMMNDSDNTVAHV
ncbi:hypothetical protein [Lactiplantibacillus plantarum]|uniref:hypothetical protein n=1 Tax=Lactiplantibacillus plantarum TaxID=1590 RepID=UPI001BA474D5|nr:hypothetical protein [Lactiplantibacillus plantarum]MBS0936331.1 hypothetical protein [Lactiplantibacillus plantarum]MBS0943630.1 hypothetical protein [Lactiplantibacillus plantarum]